MPDVSALSAPAGPGLHTARFELRLLDERDAGVYRAIYTCPWVMHHVMPPLSDAAADRAFLHACIHNRRDRPGHRLWVITDGQAMPSAVGFIGLRRYANDTGVEKRAEVGIVLHQHWCRRGVSSEVLPCVLDHAFGRMALDGVSARRLDDAQARVIDRLFGPLGFQASSLDEDGIAYRRWVLPCHQWPAPTRAGVALAKSAGRGNVR